MSLVLDLIAGSIRGHVESLRFHESQQKERKHMLEISDKTVEQYYKDISELLETYRGLSGKDYDKEE